MTSIDFSALYIALGMMATALIFSNRRLVRVTIWGLAVVAVLLSLQYQPLQSNITNFTLAAFMAADILDGILTMFRYTED